MSSTITPYLPIWSREGNKLIEYKELPFECGKYRGTKIIVIFKDKKGNIREETARVKWEE